MQSHIDARGASRSQDRRALALLAACSLLLAALDHVLPKPIPFIRLGLANLPILVALTIFDFRYLVYLSLLKIVGAGLLTGMLFSYVFLFSAAGSLASLIVMYAIYRAGGRMVSLVGVSIGGAVASNLVQLALAAKVIFGGGALLLAPPFLTVGLITSVLLGTLANRFVDRSEWLAMVKKGVS